MSALSFTLGALVAILVVVLVPSALRIPGAVVVTLVGLGLLGAVGAGSAGRRSVEPRPASSSAARWPWPSAPPSAKPSAPRSDTPVI